MSISETKERSRDTGKLIFLTVIGLILFFPFIFMLSTSLKTLDQFYHYFWQPSFPLHFDNYVRAWTEIKGYLFNSIFVSGTSTLGVLLLSSLAAFAFARYKFPGSSMLFLIVISMLMIPGILTLVPSFMLVKKLGLLNSYWVLILPFIATGQIFAIFILKSFFASLPEDLFESARMDGASYWTLYWRIALPLSKPALGIIAILNVLGTWNNFIWPLVTISDSKYNVITAGLFLFSSQYGSRYGEMFAGYTLASVPLLIIFIFTIRLFIKGITSGAFKM
jgi:ABC-type glycerol-3-phosphate transport system permease component